MIPFFKRKKQLVKVELYENGDYIVEFPEETYSNFLTNLAIDFAKKKLESDIIPITNIKFKSQLKKEIEKHIRNVAKQQNAYIKIFNHEIKLMLLDTKENKVIVKGKIDYALIKKSD